MGRLDWLLAPLRAGKRIPKPVLLATAASLAAVGGAFGIALAVVEWRDEERDSTAAGRRIDDVDASLAELSDQVDQIEERLNKLTLAPSPTPTPTAPPALTPTPERSPAPTPTPEPGSSRDNPVPQGQAALAQGWEVTVLGWCRGPTAECGTILNFAAPAVGVHLRAVNVSAGEPAKFIYPPYELPFNIVYATGSADECIVSEVSLGELTVQGGTVEGDIHCHAVPDETSLLLLIGGRYFALE